MNAVELAARLRKVAEAIETLGDDCRDTISVSLWVYQPENFKAISKAMMPFEKDPDEYSYRVRSGKTGGSISLSIDRGKICKKVTVLKEVSEWQCDDSILDPTPEEVTT